MRLVQQMMRFHFEERIGYDEILVELQLLRARYLLLELRALSSNSLQGNYFERLNLHRQIQQARNTKTFTPED